MNSSASSWQPVTSGVTIEVDSGIILFCIFVNDLDELMECIFRNMQVKMGCVEICQETVKLKSQGT